jgi:hypothetical protein
LFAFIFTTVTLRSYANAGAFCHFEIAELLNTDFKPVDWERWSYPEGTGSALFFQFA